MKQILRYSFVALMAMMFAPSFAEDIIWQEDFSSYKADDVPTGGTYSYACANGGGTTKIYEAALATGTSPELLVAKKGGSFTAVVPLGGKSGSMSITYKTNRSELTLAVTGGTLGEKVRTGNADSYTIDVPSGTDNLTIVISMPESVNNNARLDDIKLYQGTAKKPAGISWGTSARTVTIGGDNTFPTLSNDNELNVSYSSSDTNVATIASDGTITLVAAGETVIKAETAETAEFEAGKAEYTLTVKAAASEEVTEINVAKALEIINALGDGKYTDDNYKVKGFVVGTPDFQRKTDGSLYGNVNLTIADTKGGSTTLTVYRGKDYDNANFNEETISRIKEGDEVVFQGKLQKYVKNNVMTPELPNGYLISVNGVTSGIFNMKAEKADGALYNLSGQRVDANYKGVVIKNGQKTIQK